MSASRNLTVDSGRFLDRKPTAGGLLGNIAGYTGGKGISEGTGKGVYGVEGRGIEATVGGLAEVSDTARVLDGGMLETEGTVEETPGMDMLLGGVPDDATRLGVELGGVARSLRA